MSFIPRPTFPSLPTSLPRSYFLGHHNSALRQLKTLLSTIDLVLEVRDYRLPLTSRNPLFESALQESSHQRKRIIVYTKRDLGGSINGSREDARVEREVAAAATAATTTTSSSGTTGTTGIEDVVFIRNGGSGGSGTGTRNEGKKSVTKLLQRLKTFARSEYKLTGHRMLIMGMPNVGKSTLLNALRAQGVHKGKVAVTGAQPGVTRRIGGGVKIVDETEEDASTATGGGGSGSAIYLLDTPGIFIPYVPSPIAMLKLALCGCVKDSVIPPVLLADYLLFHINRVNPSLYAEYSAPTNDIVELLEAMARKTGRLGKKGKPDVEGTAVWMVQRWRTGWLGRFVLDRLGDEREEEERMGSMGEQAGGKVVMSISQARKVERERRRERPRDKGKKGA